MRTLIVGCNHRSAPVEVRERIAFDEAALAGTLRLFSQRFPCAEVVLVSTCNRMEFYIARPVHGHPRLDEVAAFIGSCHGVEPQEFSASLYSHEDVQAVRHLFRVVSSLDSMVLGESQILAQAKSAFDTARTAGTVGKHLEGLFQRALAVAKDVHTRTAIATGRLSVGSTAVDLARQIFSRFDDKTVLMVGAGEMGELTLTHLLETRPRRLWVTNRTDSRATELAARLGERHQLKTEAVPFSQWIDHLAEVDIVISCTGSREPILDGRQFAKIPAKRGYRPILIIDIAVPRDIDPSVGEDESVYLYNVDDLQSVVELNLAQRRDAIHRCHEIIEANVVEFVEKQQRQRADIGPLIELLRRRFHEIGEGELERVWPKLHSMDPRDRELIEQMLHRLTQKLLHHPVRLLSEGQANGEAAVYAGTLRALFDLGEAEPPPPPPLRENQLEPARKR